MAANARGFVLSTAGKTSKILLGQLTRTFSSPIDRTWALWSSFGAAQLYIAGCDAVSLRGFGVGSTRTLWMPGHQVHETLQLMNPITYTYAYSIGNVPGLPFTGAMGQIQLRALGTSGTEINWKGFVDSVESGQKASVREQLELMYHDSIEKARLTLEKGQKS